MNDRVMQFRVGVVVLATAIIAGILVVLFGQVELDATGGVSVVAEIDTHVPIYRDEQPRIASTILGDAEIQLVPGTIRPPRQRLGTDETLMGAVSKDPFEVFAQLEPKLGGALESLTTASDAVTKLSASLDKALLGEDQRFSRLVDKTEAALDSFNVAMGNVNDVLGDPAARDKLKAALDDLPAVMAELRRTAESMGKTIDAAGRNIENLEGITRPLGERGPGMVAQLDRTIGRLDETLQQAATFTRALNESQGTLGRLVRDPQVYEELAQAAANVNGLTRELRPIVDDVRVFTDKIARHPEQLGVRGALDRRPGLK